MTAIDAAPCEWTVKDFLIPDGPEAEEAPSAEARWRQYLWSGLLPRAQSTWITRLQLDYALPTWSLDKVRHLLTFVCSLKHLEDLYLSCNKLTPAHLERLPLGRLQKLRFVDLANNRVEEWPANFLRFNAALENLDCSGNGLPSAPGFLLRLEGLQNVRWDRSSPFNSCLHQLARRRRTKFVKSPPRGTTSVTSLQALSFQVLLSSPELFRRISGAVLHILHADWPVVAPCDFCFKALPPEGHFTVLVFPHNFAGATHLPIKAKVCSEPCAADIFARWDWSVNEKEAEDHFYCTVGADEARKRPKCCSVM